MATSSPSYFPSSTRSNPKYDIPPSSPPIPSPCSRGQAASKSTFAGVPAAASVSARRIDMRASYPMSGMSGSLRRRRLRRDLGGTEPRKVDHLLERILRHVRVLPIARSDVSGLHRHHRRPELDPHVSTT